MTNIDDLIEVLQKAVPEPALYEQMAEESAELAKAALKMSRILRGENPTPVTRYEAEEMIREELSDLFTVCLVLDTDYDIFYVEKKLKRWAERVKA